MKTLKALTILILALSAFTACDKNKNNGGNNNSSRFLLDRETLISSSGDTALTEYRYNTSNQLSGFALPEGDISIRYKEGKIDRLEGIDEGVETFSVFSYSAVSGDKPSSISSFVRENGAEEALVTNNFIYENNKLTSIELIDPEDDNLTAFIEYNYQGENVNSSKFFTVIADSSSFLSSETIYTYDDKLSPYSLLPFFGQFSKISKNNALTENTKFYNEDGSIDFEINMSFTYMYNSDNFASQSVNSSTGDTILYEYLEKSGD